MALHLDTNDPKYAEAAAEILRRHDNGEPEANITSAVRHFLITTRLAKPSEIVEENPPAEGSRRAVDLTALDTFVEFKTRIGTTGGFNPAPKNVEQLDDYLAQSQREGRVRMGILTDGKYWLLRWPSAGSVKTLPPYGFTFEDPDRWITLYEWLRDHALSTEENKPPNRGTIADASVLAVLLTNETSRPSRPFTTATPTRARSRSSGSFGTICYGLLWERWHARRRSGTTSSCATPI